MVTGYRPAGSGMPYFVPAHSIIFQFPQAVESAYRILCESEELREQYLSWGATEDGIRNAFEFYGRYFECLLNNEADTDPFGTFQNNEIPNDVSFVIVQGLIASQLLTHYHMALVETQSEVPEKYAAICRAAETIFSNELFPIEKNE